MRNELLDLSGGSCEPQSVDMLWSEAKDSL